jgi:hypothetical protein
MWESINEQRTSSFAFKNHKTLKPEKELKKSQYTTSLRPQLNIRDSCSLPRSTHAKFAQTKSLVLVNLSHRHNFFVFFFLHKAKNREYKWERNQAILEALSIPGGWGRW